MLYIFNMEALCKERFFELPVALFRLFSCSMCYKYLFYTGQKLQPHSMQPWMLVPVHGSDFYSQEFSVIADVTNATSVDLVCNSLTGENCNRWTECCHAAISCCKKQLSEPGRNASNGAFCPRTWDGYSCFEDTNPDTRTYISCPTYVDHSSGSDENCKRWTDCCFAAISCCKKQLNAPKRNASSDAFCPRTWDGYGCFEDTNTETRTYISCPNYVEHSSESVVADVSNVTSVGLVCNSLTGDNCKRWTDCCYAAISCCNKQLSTPKGNISNGAFCPRTWDGYGCIEDTNPDTRTYISCPSYVEHSSASERAYKDCTENGTWWVNPKTGSEWTNYSTCVPTKDFHTVVNVVLACNIISLVLLIPACIIFISIRQLRTQKRIKLHICLFLSFILASVVTIMWDMIVYKDRLQNEKSNTVMHQNSGGCKFLYILLRYASTANFFWMFCEGFYLHRLIVHAFAVPKTLLPYYIFGWIVSWIPAIIYSAIRVTNRVYNTSCWVHNMAGVEWVMYTPNLLCIAANLVFLGNILRILCSKLQAHPNEPSNYRKALKATFVLVPLFGLQQFVIIYRPQTGTRIDFVYDIIQAVVKNTQGAIVALIFCFLNGEVHTYLRNCLGRHIKFGPTTTYNRKSSMSSATQFTSVAQGRRATKQFENSDTGYIALSTSSTANDVSNVTSPSNGHVTFSI